MAFSFTESFFIGCAAGIGVTFLALAIIFLSLRATQHGAFLSAWLSPGKSPGKSPTVPQASPKENVAPTSVLLPIQAPPSRTVDWRNPNPITKDNRQLFGRLHALRGPEEISENVGFEYGLTLFAQTHVYGDGSPTTMPTVDRSVFDDEELIRLAGEPPESVAWSELISDVNTRYYAIYTFLVRVMYRRMDPNCDVQECLLPTEVSSCYQLIPDPNFRKREDFVSVWREILFMMLKARYDLVDIPSHGLHDKDPRRERAYAMASEVVATLNLKLLDPHGTSEDKIAKNLSRDFGHAANSALILFGQPSVWEADWVSDEPGRLAAPRIRFMWNGQVKWTRAAVHYTPHEVFERRYKLNTA